MKIIKIAGFSLVAALLIASCKKDQSLLNQVSVESGGSMTAQRLLPDSLPEDDPSDSVSVVNGVFHFKDKFEAISMASYLCAKKYQGTSLRDYYNSVGLHPLEFVYDSIFELDNEANIHDSILNGVGPKIWHPAFMDNHDLFRTTEVNGEIELSNVYNIDWPVMSFILNDQKKFYIGTDLYELSNGNLLCAGNPVSLFDPTPAHLRPMSCPPYVLPSNKEPSWEQDEKCGGRSGNPYYRVKCQRTGSWIAKFYAGVLYTSNNNPCNMNYSIQYYTWVSMQKCINGNQNSPIAVHGNYGTNIIPSSSPPANASAFKHFSSGYYFGATSRQITLSWTANVTLTTALHNWIGFYPQQFHGRNLSDFIRLSDINAKAGVPGGCCGALVQLNIP